jgi:heme/copper-type cytochrome/quinol oxidase subunit 3
LAQRQGWYGERRLVQALSMVLLALGVGGGFACFYLKTRISFHAHPGASLGILMLLVFVLLRAFEFNHVLGSLLQEPASDYLDHTLEGIALVLIGISAWRACRR